MNEIKLIYYRDEGKYYVYDDGLCISKCNRLIDALQYFLPLITNDVEVANGCQEWTVKSYGKRVISVREGK